MKAYHVIGLMSGTSLDGLDITYNRFAESAHWSFEILKAEMIEFPTEILDRLCNAYNASAMDLVKTDHAYGAWMGEQINHFLTKHALAKPDLIVSHGQTVFHQPQQGFTCQIGNGWMIAQRTGCRVVNDLRSADVALGGQGAPLVPIGDQLLFPQYHFCLNIGGFSNVSYQNNHHRLAYDICPVNILLNAYAAELGLQYDDRGMLAKQGQMDAQVLEALNSLPYYHQAPPKSLGFEWVEQHVLPVLQEIQSPHDRLATATHHAAWQVAHNLKATSQHLGIENPSVLITGGGAFNSHLLDLINHYSEGHLSLTVPEQQLVKFKESLVFALLGLLRWLGRNNALSSVTGASRDSSGGTLYSL
jgi:anhydro-N-acetylmuramic acid kinase